MSRSIHLVPRFALLAVLMACQQPTAELSQADKDAVQATIDTYVQAALARDFDAWGQTLADDVFYSPPNRAPLNGREAAVEWVRAFPPLTSFTVTMAEIGGAGDLAYARGTYRLEHSLADDLSTIENGTFLDLHRRAADGSWQYTHVFFHSTDPLPEPSAVSNE